MNPNGSARDRVVMLVKNSFVFDARVRKEAASLRTAGWDVAVIALHVPGATPRYEETPEGIPVWRVPQLFAHRQKWLGAATATPVMREAAVGHGRNRSRLAGLRRVLVDVIRRASPLITPAARRLNSFVVDRRMIRVASALEPCVVHAHDLNTLSAGGRLADKTGARLVYDAHEFHRARNGMSSRTAISAARLEDRLGPRADLVITATDTWADRLHALGTSAHRPLVLRNAPPSSRIDTSFDLRGRLSIPAESSLLVYIGSVQRGRGIEQAMEALLLLPSSVHLVVLGYGAHLPALRDLRHSLGLAERAHFPGPVDNREVVRWVAGADVGLCLIGNTSYSYFTSLPNKLLDYVQARIPVVTSDFPEMGGFVRQHRVGEVCDPADPRSVADACSHVLRHHGSYRAPLEAAAQSSTWEAEEKGLLSAYQVLTTAEAKRNVDLQ